MASSTEASRLAEHCRARLSLESLPTTNGRAYVHLPLCILDSVWSIRVRYSGVANIVARYRAHYAVDAGAELAHTVSEIIANIEAVGVASFATEVVKNSQRTSPRGGVLKADAVLQWARVLRSQRIETFAGLPAYGADHAMEARLQTIPGQGSGISLRYFFMLCGDESLIKPDQMTARFLEAALSRSVSPGEMQTLYSEACSVLNARFPSLTPRLLDNAVWRYQRAVMA